MFVPLLPRLRTRFINLAKISRVRNGAADVILIQSNLAAFNASGLFLNLANEVQLLAPQPEGEALKRASLERSGIGLEFNLHMSFLTPLSMIQHALYHINDTGTCNITSWGSFGVND